MGAPRLTAFRRLAGRGVSLFLVAFFFEGLLCMNLHPTLGRILLVIVVAHAILYLAFSSLHCGFVAANLFAVQETPSAKDVDLTCSLIFLFRQATCLPVGPMSLEWLVDPFGRSDSSGPSLPPDVPCAEQQRVVLPASELSRWRQGALHAQPQISQRSTGWGFRFRRLSMYYLEHPGPCWICFLQTKEQRVQTQPSQKTLGLQQNHLSPGSAWKGQVSSGHPGIGSTIPFMQYISSC